MERVFYAINNREFESLIEKGLESHAITADTAIYKEAVVEKLPYSGATVLILIDSLGGSISTEELLRMIRHDHSNVRIILITKAGESAKNLRSVAFSLGIYDIIASDNVPYSAVVDCVKHPRSYRDSYSYSSDRISGAVHRYSDENSEDTDSKKRLFGFSRSKKKKAKTENEQTLSTYSDREIDVALVRKTLKEEATRSAQKDLDELIKIGVADRTSELTAKISELSAQIEDDKTLLASKDASIEDLSEKVQVLTSENESLRMEMSDLSKKMQDGFDLYEERIKALQSDVNTPAWYKEQEEKWSELESSYIKRIEELEKQLQSKGQPHKKGLFK